MVLFNAWFSIAQVSLILLFAFSMHSIKYNDFALRLSLLNMLQYSLHRCLFMSFGYISLFFNNRILCMDEFNRALVIQGSRFMYCFLIVISFRGKCVSNLC